jgi:putative endonuclease
MEIVQRERGRLGEEVAALLLASRGYRLVARNLRVGRCEIDLVLERGTLLVAVEVKWRHTGTDPAAALGAWSPAQRARARGALLGAMQTVPGGERRPWRFDLVTVSVTAKGWCIEHHRGALSPGETFW